MEEAKELFSGKMLRETLVERLEHANFDEITRLDLADLSISFIGCFDATFTALRTLHLERNRLRSLDALLPLRQLEVLRVTENLLESVLFTHEAPLAYGHFARMTELYLDGNAIVSMDALRLEIFPALQLLDLQNNGITKVPHSFHGDTATRRLSCAALAAYITRSCSSLGV